MQINISNILAALAQAGTQPEQMTVKDAAELFSAQIAIAQRALEQNALSDGAQQDFVEEVISLGQLLVKPDDGEAEGLPLDTPDDSQGDFSRMISMSVLASVQMPPVETVDVTEVEPQTEYIAPQVEVAYPQTDAVYQQAAAGTLVEDIANTEIISNDVPVDMGIGGGESAGILEGFVPDGTDARVFSLPEVEEGAFAGQIIQDPVEAVDEENSAVARMPLDVAQDARQEPDEVGITIIHEGSLENADGQKKAKREPQVESEEPVTVEMTQETEQPEHTQTRRMADDTRIQSVRQEPEPKAVQETAVTPEKMDSAESAPEILAAPRGVAEGVFAPDNGLGQNADAALLPPAEQIALETVLNQGVGRNHFVMKLNPESLGEVTVRMIMHADGVVARISVSNENARSEIASQLYQLGDSMREKGIDVRSVEIVQNFSSQTSMLNDGNRSSNPYSNQKRGRYRSQTPVQAVAAAQGYDETIMSQIITQEAETEGLAVEA